MAYTEDSEGQDIYQLEFLSCNGNESNLLECSSGGGSSGCSETVAGVKCAGKLTKMLFYSPFFPSFIHSFLSVYRTNLYGKGGMPLASTGLTMLRHTAVH